MEGGMERQEGRGGEREKGEGRRRGGKESGRGGQWTVIPPNQNPGYGLGLLQK